MLLPPHNVWVSINENCFLKCIPFAQKKFLLYNIYFAFNTTTGASTNRTSSLSYQSYLVNIFIITKLSTLNLVATKQNLIMESK